MSIADELQAARYKQWWNASVELYRCKELAPRGQTAAAWAKLIQEHVAATKVAEGLIDHKDPKLDTSRICLTPFARLKEVVAAGLDGRMRNEYRVAASVFDTAINRPRSLRGELSAVLKSPRIETVRACVESIVDAAYYHEPSISQEPVIRPPRPITHAS